MRSLKVMSVVYVYLISALLSSSAYSYSNIFVFGDSLSDNGNLMAIDPSFPERFTNGPLSLEVVASEFGFVLEPSYHLLQAPPFGNNYAIAGARSIDDDANELTPDINLPTQVNAFLSSHGGVAPADALYVIMIGGNDIRTARDLYATSVFAKCAKDRNTIKKQALQHITDSVASELAQVQKLIAAGAVNIVVSNAPNMDAVPEADSVVAGMLASSTTKAEVRRSEGVHKATESMSEKFNQLLAKKLKRIEHESDIDVLEFDLFQMQKNQLADKTTYPYVDDPCVWVFTQGGVVNPACTDFPTASGFLFWDEIHPTTQSHQETAVEMIGLILSQ